MRKGARLAAWALLVLAAGCAPKTPAPLVVTTPKYPEFIVPVIPAEAAGTPEAASVERGWQFLQAGDFKSAERAMAAALKARPLFYPAEAGSGYIELARQELKLALPHFDRAIESRPDYVPAIVGRGQTLLAMNRGADAIQSFERALALDASLTDLKRQVDVLRFRGVEEDLSTARQAASAGKLDEAVGAYRQALAATPDSAFLYRELGIVERRRNNADAALQDFQKAVALDPSDAASFEQIGDLLAERGDLPGALDALDRAFDLDPSDPLKAKRDQVRGRLELARLPAEYRAIPGQPQMTRAELAALIGVGLAPLLRPTTTQDAVVLTDVRNNWAENWIMAVTRAGVMEAFSNHTFQPRALVRRADLAQILARLLADIGRTPGGAVAGAGRVRFPDLPPGHLAYSAASASVASGLMSVGSEGTFQPARVVTGEEAIESIAKIRGLANLGATASAWRP